MLLHLSEVSMLSFNGHLGMHTRIMPVFISKDTKHIRKIVFLMQIII